MSELLDASTWRTFGSDAVLMIAISIAELRRAGVTIAAHEAVAIAQHLIHDIRARIPEPPYGSPSPDNVSIGADGTVICRGCTVTLTASEIAIFLQAVLSNGAPVPGGLRYAIARAMHEVDAPPFDSVDDFSVVLAHYERGARLDVVRALAAKMEPHRHVASVSRMTIDRRRAGPSSSELRRLLREADRELFEQRLFTPPPPAPRPMGSRLRILGAAILCVLAIGGASVSGPRVDRSPALQPAEVVPSAPRAVNVTGDAVLSGSGGAGPSRPRSDRGPKRAAPQQRGAPQRRAAPPQKVVAQQRVVPQRAASLDRDRQGHKAASRGVLDVLRLRWLRRTIVVRDDL
jgi:hypothetical protein